MSKKAIFDKKNILVVGGAGFIGSHLCDELIKENKVICLDNFLTGKEDHIAHLLQNPDFSFINHDIVNPINLDDYPNLDTFKMEFQGLQEVYFLASPGSPKAYKQYPIEAMLANSVGLRNALDMAIKYKAKLLYASSSAVYGEVEVGSLIKEDYVGKINQLDERACFAEAKRFGETMINNYRLKFDLDAKIARIFNCYGPRMELNDGRMVPEIIAAAVDNKDVTIYGEKGSVGSYFYIDDLIKGLTKMMASAEYGPINFGSDWKISFGEVAEKAVAIAKSKSKINYQSQGEMMSSQALPDISLVKEKLGWFPIILLDEGLKYTINYLSAQRDVRGPETAD